MSRGRTASWRAWAALVLLGAAVGCRRAGASPEASAPSTRRYTIRAEVVGLPERPGGELTLRHEAVDDFTDPSGAVVGMDSMVMPFPVAPGDSPGDLAVGDKIQGVLVVDWDRASIRLERIQKLPRETQLHFRNARSGGKT